MSQPTDSIVADAYGATVRLGREDWGVVMDALIDHLILTIDRQSADDGRSAACARLIKTLGAGLSAAPVGGSR